MFYTRQTGSLSYFVQWSHEDDLVDKKEEEDKQKAKQLKRNNNKNTL